jgi:hypothetical protein
MGFAKADVAAACCAWLWDTNPMTVCVVDTGPTITLTGNRLAKARPAPETEAVRAVTDTAPPEAMPPNADVL